MATRKPPSRTNTPAVRRRVGKAARAAFESPLESPRAVFRHGRWWVVAYDREEERDVTFSVYDMKPGVAGTGFDFELVE